MPSVPAVPSVPVVPVVPAGVPAAGVSTTVVSVVVVPGITVVTVVVSPGTVMVSVVTGVYTAVYNLPHTGKPLPVCLPHCRNRYGSVPVRFLLHHDN